MDHYIERTVPGFDGTPIWFRRIGSGEPTLALCDGVGCDGYIWKYFIPFFQGQRRIVHFQYRGHGASGVPDDLARLGIEECAMDLLSVLDAAEIDAPVVVFGHSMGVQVALEFYHRNPERVRALGLVTGSYGKALDHVHDNSLLRRVFPLIRLVNSRFSGPFRNFWRELLRSELAYWLATAFEITEGLIKREDFFPYFEHLAHMDPEIFLRTLSSAARHTAEPYLSDIRVPTLIVAGELDRFTPYWLSRRMHAMISGSELLTLPMASHTGPIELPELMNLRVARFLSAVDGAAGQ